MSTIPKALSPGEEAMQLHLRAEKILFIREYEFCPGRKWRFDFVLMGDNKIAIEIQGGTFSRNVGAHSRGKPYRNDCEKGNMAIKLGWSVLRYSTDMVLAGDAINDVLELVRPERANTLRGIDGMNAIALERAFLCPDCSWIVDSPDSCHRCGNCLGLLSLGTVLNRATVPLPARDEAPVGNYSVSNHADSLRDADAPLAGG